MGIRIFWFWRLLAAALAARTSARIRETARGARRLLATTPEHLIAGRRGERFVVRWLRRRGCHIVRHDYRCRAGQIDIIALDGETVVFVEVKTRGPGEEVFARELPEQGQKRRILRASAWFLRHRGVAATNVSVRYDVALVSRDRDGMRMEQYVRGAFGKSDGT